jgi:hypothetical protein
LLHRLLVHLAYSDGVVQGDEFALLQRVRADLEPGELMAWAMEEALGDFDDADLKSLVQRGETPMDILRFAARMICLDGDVADAERLRLAEIATVLRLPKHAPDRAIGEVVATGGSVSAKHVKAALSNMLWRTLQPRLGDPERAVLVAAAPAGKAVCTLVLDGAEVGALYAAGLLSHFDDGVRFIAFESVATYTRVPVPGAGFHLRTTGKLHVSISDPRMADLGGLLDYVFRDE